MPRSVLLRPIELYTDLTPLAAAKILLHTIFFARRLAVGDD